MLWRGFKNIQSIILFSRFITSAHNTYHLRQGKNLLRGTVFHARYSRHCLPCTVFKLTKLVEFRNFDALPTNLILITNEYIFLNCQTRRNSLLKPQIKDMPQWTTVLTHFKCFFCDFAHIINAHLLHKPYNSCCANNIIGIKQHKI
jgi:hypothetical protein